MVPRKSYVPYDYANRCFPATAVWNCFILGVLWTAAVVAFTGFTPPKHPKTEGACILHADDVARVGTRRVLSLRGVGGAI